MENHYKYINYDTVRLTHDYKNYNSKIIKIRSTIDEIKQEIESMKIVF